MRSKLNCLLCFLALALPVSAQLDSAQLRVKFGMPLSRVQAKSGAPGREIVNVREFFDVPPGFSLVADYGAGNQVCKLQVAGLMPRQKMQAFLSELVPDSMRGKEMGRGERYARAREAGRLHGLPNG